MLAHLKAKQRDCKIPEEDPSAKLKECDAHSTISTADTDLETSSQATKMTCDALCSLSSSQPLHTDSANASPIYEFEETCEKTGKRLSIGGCPKQHQLPMFLSKTYHMIDRCDSTIATWSPSGDNFVVKNVEKFASNVLPMYFKHSNFSSFARQLNFYGFRKLKAEPILTADFDARTACYVRFYHEKFQKNKPELLSQIKRATKSDQQSKDDVEILKTEISKLKKCISAMSSDYDRRMTEMSYEYNRRITALSAEYDRLAVLMQQVLANQGASSSALVAPAASSTGEHGVADMMNSLSQVAAISLQNLPNLTAATAEKGTGASATVHSQAPDNQQKRLTRPPDFETPSQAKCRVRLS
mmetsp:Transcript_10780/g.15884  ORF Transcript_10780/g.15884 Transcript_10780/m.15884 type:complete len:357 (-) Transcript_10780:3067-4137(-)